MKPRHAAALALFAACAGPSVKTFQSTGWQIMRPPQIKGNLDETAPLSEWVVHPADIDVYPTQKECEQMIDNWREGSNREDFHNAPVEVQRASKEAAKDVDRFRCISINDPRLKEK